MKIGDRVRMTGKFLRSTGQYAGLDSQQVWKVLGFDGGWAVVNEETDTRYFTDEELKLDPSLQWRRIHVGNLEIVRAS